MTGTKLAFNPADVHIRLEDIATHLKAEDGAAAQEGILQLLAGLEKLPEQITPGTDASNRAPQPWRLIAAHLKSAEVQIQATRLALALESVGQAVGVVLDGGGIAVAPPAVATEH